MNWYVDGWGSNETLPLFGIDRHTDCTFCGSFFADGHSVRELVQSGSDSSTV